MPLVTNQTRDFRGITRYSPVSVITEPQCRTGGRLKPHAHMSTNQAQRFLVGSDGQFAGTWPIWWRPHDSDPRMHERTTPVRSAEWTPGFISNTWATAFAPSSPRCRPGAQGAYAIWLKFYAGGKKEQNFAVPQSNGAHWAKKISNQCRPPKTLNRRNYLYFGSN